MMHTRADSVVEQQSHIIDNNTHMRAITHDNIMIKTRVHELAVNQISIIHIDQHVIATTQEHTMTTSKRGGSRRKQTSYRTQANNDKQQEWTQSS